MEYYRDAPACVVIATMQLFVAVFFLFVCVFLSHTYLALSAFVRSPGRVYVVLAFMRISLPPARRGVFLHALSLRLLSTVYLFIYLSIVSSRKPFLKALANPRVIFLFCSWLMAAGFGFGH